ncbi:MAG: 23S rRNA (uracil(1939)-C(5))-methyltransferase RlmD [Candidatus Berkelbacteria bacterium]|nr:23S rRNA (uracil(1939)-C(5))-methyltransferase RlmD [Candidatus Berkelbacteria bacterium]
MNEVQIEKLIFGGAGLGRLADKRPVFVSKSLPDDLLDIEITKSKKDFAEAKIIKVVKPSPIRQKPLCPYFEECGGCDYQNMNYENQLAQKSQIFAEVLARAKVSTKILPIIAGSNAEFFYRNTNRYYFTHGTDGNLSLAMHHFNDAKKLIPIRRCSLLSESSNNISASLLQYLNKFHFSDNPFSQIRFREGKATGETMIEIFTSSKTLPSQEGIVEVLKKFPEVKSLYHSEISGDDLNSARRRLIFGRPVIYEKIGKFTFQISPDSFFQTNSEGAKTLYDKIKFLTEIDPTDRILDLFCGTGTIGIYLSTLTKEVLGVDIVQSAVNDAKANTRLNKILNCQFMCADLSDLKQFKNLATKQFTKIIFDPPRTGLNKDLIQELCNLMNLKNLKLIYVSCNPSTFCRDAKLFESLGVNLELVEPIDLFPQTQHIECVGVFRKQ